jgi:predicted dehydrogenase
MLRWGILSTARINRALLPALRASSRSELTAVASRSVQRAADFAHAHGIPRSLAAYSDLVDDPNIDVIYNPLPNSLHAEWTIRAARAGKHVLCEKPLALSVSEIDAIADAAQSTAVVVAEAFMYRHHPQTLRVRSLVEDGAIGALTLIRGAFTFILNRAGDVRLAPELGGGCLWDVGCYPVSFARFLAGEPEEVVGWANAGPSGVDMGFLGQLRFPGGVLAQFDAGFTAPFRTGMEIVGSEGVLRVAHSFKPGPLETLVIERDDGVQELPVQGPEELYLGEVEDLENAILAGTQPRVSLEESRGNVRTLTALLRSAREGRSVLVGGGGRAT